MIGFQVSPEEDSRRLGRVRFKGVLMPDLRRATVFLSASFPSGERGESYTPYDASGIADAVSAFARAILGSNGQLLFGGHPTITPLVFMIAREMRIQHSLVVFQSAWFRNQKLPEVDEIEREKLGRLVWTPETHTRGHSLRIMRNDMIDLARICVGALFIGGMEGILDEYNLVKKRSPEIPCIPVTGPGGAAARLPKAGWDALGLAQIHKSRAYPFVALRIVNALAERGVGTA